MEPLTVLVGVFGSGTALVASSYLYSRFTRLFREEWTTTYRGHAVRLVASHNNKELWVDGTRVAQKTTLSGMGTTLCWTLGGEVPVELSASIVHGVGNAKPTGQIYANGEWIGGDAPKNGHARTAGSDLPEPKDPRWTAAKRLLGDLRGMSDARATEAADTLDRALRNVLGRLDRLSAASEAHKALGGNAHGMLATRTQLDGSAHELLDALRDFHLAALAGGATPSLERVTELHARIVADTEVEALAQARPTVKQ